MEPTQLPNETTNIPLREIILCKGPREERDWYTLGGSYISANM